MITFFVRQSIKYPGVVVAVALTVVLYGLYVLSRANLDVFPEFSPSQVVIQTEAPGLSAELVERQVTQLIENALAGATSVEHIRSQSIPGLSVVTVLFREGSSAYRNRQVVSERLAALANQLPHGVAQPSMTPLTSSASTVLGVGLTSKTRSLMEIRTLVDWTLRPHLLAVEGVAEINVFGGEVLQWQVQVDPEKLMRYGLSIQEVVQAARRSTGVLPAGYVRTDSQHLIVNVEAQPRSVEDLGRVMLTQKAGQVLRLADVAKVLEGPAPSISAAAINGEPGVFLMVQGQLGANTRAVTLDLERALKELEPFLAGEQVTLNARLFRPANFIETAVRNVQRDLLIGSALVVVVLFLFLFNTRTAFICAKALWAAVRCVSERAAGR
jgi:Cu/Ag efflux pump CusA